MKAFPEPVFRRARLFWLSAPALAFVACLQAGETAAPAEPDIATYLKGKAVYERNCAVCHGERGDGRGEMAESLVPRPRSFREGQFKFRSTPYGKLPTDADLRRTITGGLSGTGMGKFANLSDSETGAVIAYLKFFSRRWRKAENLAPPVELPPAPEWFGETTALAARAPAGKALFATHCAPCHGPDADGHGPLAPHLRDTAGQPLAATDLRQPFLRAGRAPEDLYRLLSTGMNGTPMPGFGETLSPAQRWEITAYLVSIRLPAGPTLDAAEGP